MKKLLINKILETFNFKLEKIIQLKYLGIEYFEKNCTITIFYLTIFFNYFILVNNFLYVNILSLIVGC